MCNCARISFFFVIFFGKTLYSQFSRILEISRQKWGQEEWQRRPANIYFFFLIPPEVRTQNTEPETKKNNPFLHFWDQVELSGSTVLSGEIALSGEFLWYENSEKCTFLDFFIIIIISFFFL